MATRKALALISGLIGEINTPTDKVDFAGNTTTDLTEGSNLYYLDSRARSSVSISNSGTGYGSLSYSSTTGVITYAVVTSANIRGNLSASTSGTGYGSLSYNSSTGVITYAVVTDANIRGSLSVTAGNGLTYNSTTGAFGTSAIPNSQLANSSVQFGSTTVSLGGSSSSISGLTSLSSTTVTGSTSVTGGSSVLNSTTLTFTGGGFTSALGFVTPTAARTINLPDGSGTIALLTSISVSNSGTGYGSLSYNSSTGVITYAVVTDANIRGSLSVTAGSGLTYNSTTGAFGTSAIPNSQLQNSSITVGSTAIALGSSSTTIAGLTSITSTNSSLGVATATSVNKVAITAPATGSTLTIADGKTLTVSNTITFQSTDGVTVNFGAGGSFAFLAANNAFTGANTFTNVSGQSFRQASTQDAIIVNGRAGGTNSYAITLVPSTLTSSQTITLPDETATLASQDFATAIAIALG